MRDSPRGKSRQTADMTGTGLRLELSSDDAIIGKTLDGIITTWNAGAERLYGYAAREVVGRPISIIIPPQVEDELPMILDRLARGERVEHYETVRVARDGRRIEVSITVSSTLDPAGRIIGASSIARESPIAREAEAAVRERDALRYVAGLAAAAAHEINNPLAVVVGQAQLLGRDARRCGPETNGRDPPGRPAHRGDHRSHEGGQPAQVNQGGPVCARDA